MVARIEILVGAYSLLKVRDAEVNERLDQLVQERRKAQTLHKLSKDYEEDASRHVYMALTHLEEAINEYYAAKKSARNIARHIGWSLELDFSIRGSGIALVSCQHHLTRNSRIAFGHVTARRCAPRSATRCITARCRDLAESSLLFG
jgi:hypothetical protein